MGKGAGSAARSRFEDELEGAEDAAATAWQRGQALDTWAKIKAGDHTEVSKEDIDAEFDAALHPLGARSA